jgi:preprotein translocase subunit YajC
MPEALQSMAPMLLFLIVAYGAMYIMMIRPQQREHRERIKMLKEMKKGDRVVTAGGLIGWIAGFKDDTVKLRLADKIEVEVEKSAITRMFKE